MRLFNLTEGEIRNVDMDAKNLFIKHGEFVLLPLRRCMFVGAQTTAPVRS